MEVCPVAPEVHLAVTLKDHGVFKGASWRRDDFQEGDWGKAKTVNLVTTMQFDAFRVFVDAGLGSGGVEFGF